MQSKVMHKWDAVSMNTVKQVILFVLLLALQSQFFLYFLGLKLALIAPLILLVLLIVVYCEYEFILVFIWQNKFILLYLIIGFSVNMNSAVVAVLKLSIAYVLLANSSKIVARTIKIFVVTLSSSIVLSFLWYNLGLPTRLIEIVDGERSSIISFLRILHITPFGAVEHSEVQFNRAYGLFGEPSEAVFFLFPFLYHYLFQKKYSIAAVVFLGMCFTGSTSLIFLIALMIFAMLLSDRISKKVKLVFAFFSIIFVALFLFFFGEILVSRFFSFGSDEVQISRLVTLNAYFENNGAVEISDFAAPNTIILFVFKYPFLLILLLADLISRFKRLPKNYSRFTFGVLLFFQSFITTAYYESLPIFFLSSGKTKPDDNDQP